MKRTVLLALLLAGSVLARSVGAQARWQEASYANIGGWQPVSSWCDTPERVLALTAPQGSGSPVELAQWVGGKLSVQGWQLGLPDPGAGQV